MYSKDQIKLLQQHYQTLAEQLLALLRSGLLTKGSQEHYEANMNYDRWLAKSKVLLLVLNEGSVNVGEKPAAE